VEEVIERVIVEVVAAAIVFAVTRVFRLIRSS
jgi:hypothetical protein